jgi:hypothetical protein
VALSATFDNSLTELAMSNLECLTKYNKIPTLDQNFVCCSIVINMSSLSGQFTIDLGGAGVSKSLSDSTNASNFC